MTDVTPFPRRAQSSLLREWSMTDVDTWSMTDVDTWSKTDVDTWSMTDVDIWSMTDVDPWSMTHVNLVNDTCKPRPRLNQVSLGNLVNDKCRHMINDTRRLGQ